jgi:hypothetical protein
MMRFLAAWALILCAVSAHADTIDLYIIGGQSNAFESRIGSGDVVPENLLQTYPGIRYSIYDMYYNYANDWTTLRPRNLSAPEPGVGIGLEMSFGVAVDQAQENPIAILKVWRGGASLDTDFDPYATDGLMAYQSMMTYINAQIGVLEALGHTVNVSGFAWIQGEADASLGTDVAGRYGSNLAEFINAVRTDLNAPTMPFVYNRLNIGIDYINKDGVRAGQEWVSANVPHVVMLDVDNVPLGPDLHHYDLAGKITLGQMFADAVLFGPHREDFNGDGLVNADDLNIVVANWNRAVPPDSKSLGDADGDGFVGQRDLARVVNRIPRPLPPLRFSDFDGDDFVGIADLNAMLERWNTTVPPGELGTPDTNGDGFIGVADLSRLLSQWNTTRTEPEAYVPTIEDLDLDGSGDIGKPDLDLLLALWSYAPASGGGAAASLPSDFNADGVVDINDLRYLLELIPDDPKLGPADLDGDGFIGIGDLTRVLSHFGQPVAPGHPVFGDINGDGFVGIEDLNSLLGKWNTGTPPADIPASLPEPASIGLFCLTAGLVGTRRR